LRAVARLDFAIGHVPSPEFPEPRSETWTPELSDRLVEGMRACRWFLAAGFDPPKQFGGWLRKNLAEAGLQPGSAAADFYASAVLYAADEVDHLGEEWRQEWSL